MLGSCADDDDDGIVMPSPGFIAALVTASDDEKEELGAMTEEKLVSGGAGTARRDCSERHVWRILEKFPPAPPLRLRGDAGGLAGGGAKRESRSAGRRFGDEVGTSQLRADGSSIFLFFFIFYFFSLFKIQPSRAYAGKYLLLKCNRSLCKESSRASGCSCYWRWGSQTETRWIPRIVTAAWPVGYLKRRMRRRDTEELKGNSWSTVWFGRLAKKGSLLRGGVLVRPGRQGASFLRLVITPQRRERRGFESVTRDVLQVRMLFSKLTSVTYLLAWCWVILRSSRACRKVEVNMVWRCKGRCEKEGGGSENARNNVTYKYL